MYTSIMSSSWSKHNRKITFFRCEETRFKQATWNPEPKHTACTKTRNTETKPPERNHRNHRNHRNSRNETTETTGTTETKSAEIQLKGVTYRPQVLFAAIILTHLPSQAHLFIQFGQALVLCFKRGNRR